MLRLLSVVILLCCFSATGKVFASAHCGYSIPFKTGFNAGQNGPGSSAFIQLSENDQDDSLPQLFLPAGSSGLVCFPTKPEQYTLPAETASIYQPVRRRWLLFRRILC